VSQQQQEGQHAVVDSRTLDAVEAELQNLEELIALQQRKAQLLREARRRIMRGERYVSALSIVLLVVCFSLNQRCGLGQVDDASRLDDRISPCGRCRERARPAEQPVEADGTAQR
jgi:hypothetical protein